MTNIETRCTKCDELLMTLEKDGQRITFGFPKQVKALPVGGATGWFDVACPACGHTNRIQIPMGPSNQQN